MMKVLRWMVVLAMGGTGWANSVDLSGPPHVLGYADKFGRAQYQIDYQPLDAGNGVKLPFRYVFNSSADSSIMGDPQSDTLGWNVPLLTAHARQFDAAHRYGYIEVQLICGKKLYFNFPSEYAEPAGGSVQKWLIGTTTYSQDGQWRAEVTGFPTDPLAGVNWESPNWTLTITRWDGWKLYFSNNGLLQNLTTDTGVVINWEHSGTHTTRIALGGSNTTLLTATYSGDNLSGITVNGDTYQPQTNSNGQLEQITRPDATKDTFAYENYSSANFAAYSNACNPSAGNASMEHTDRYGVKTKLTFAPALRNIVSDGPWTYSYPDGVPSEPLYGATNIKRTRTATGEWEQISFSSDSDGIRVIRSVDGSEMRVTEGRSIGTGTYGKTSKVEKKIAGTWTQISYSAYDSASGRLIRWTDAYNKDWVYTYTDHPSNVLPHPIAGWTNSTQFAPPKTETVTDPTGRWSSYEYDTRGNIVSYNNGANVIKTYEYDSRDRRTTIKNNAGTVIAQCVYNNNDRVTSFKDASNHETTFAYLNRYGRSYLTKITSPTGLTAEFTYDSKGNRLTAKGPNGETWHFTPDTDNLLSKVTDPLSRDTNFTYDGNKNLATVENALNDTASIESDDLDLPKKLTDTLGHISNYQNNPDDSLKQLTDNRSKTYQFASTADGLRETQTFPDSTTIFSDYNLTGHMIKKTFRDASYVSATYDDAGRFTSATQSGGGGTQSVTYTAAGKLSTIANPVTSTGTENYSYDSEGRLQQITYGSAGSASFTYYTDNRLKELTYPTGMVVKYEYDSEGRVSKIYKDGVLLVNYSYDTSGRLQTKAFGASGAITETFTYGALDRLASFTVAQGLTALWNAGYTYDGIYRRIGSVYGHLGGKGDAYKYDAMGQVIGVKTNADNAAAGYDLATNETARDTYTYDAAGNSSSWTQINTWTVSYTANDINQYSAITNDTPLTYDSRGNISACGANTYLYDSFGRLATYQNNGSTVCTYAYDALGRRVRKYKTGSDYENHYLAGQSLIWVKKISGSTTTDQTFIYEPGIDCPVAQVETTGGTTQVYYVHRDVNNNVVALSNGSGLVQTYAYNVWGGYSTAVNTGPAISRFLFTSRENDMETGMYYYRARNYWPQYHRFLQLDPIGFDGGDLNLYRYCGNDPINWVDPMGTDQSPYQIPGPPPPPGQSPFGHWESDPIGMYCKWVPDNGGNGGVGGGRGGGASGGGGGGGGGGGWGDDTYYIDATGTYGVGGFMINAGTLTDSTGAESTYFGFGIGTPGLGGSVTTGQGTAPKAGTAFFQISGAVPLPGTPGGPAGAVGVTVGQPGIFDEAGQGSPGGAITINIVIKD